MRKEELIKLKNKLEQEREFAIIGEISGDFIMKAPLKSRKEILSLEDTNDMVRSCENVIEKATRLLVSKNICFDNITLASSLGIVCTKEYHENLRKSLSLLDEESNSDGEVTFIKLVKNLNENDTLLGIVPLNITLEDVRVGTNSIDFESYLTDDEINSLRISGLVNYEKFVTKMIDLGYDVTFLSSSEGITDYSSYLEGLKEDIEDSVAVNVRFR